MVERSPLQPTRSVAVNEADAGSESGREGKFTSAPSTKLASINGETEGEYVSAM